MTMFLFGLFLLYLLFVGLLVGWLVGLFDWSFDGFVRCFFTGGVANKLF